MSTRPLALLLLFFPTDAEADPTLVVWAPPQAAPFDCDADGVLDVDEASGMGARVGVYGDWTDIREVQGMRALGQGPARAHFGPDAQDPSTWS